MNSNFPGNFPINIDIPVDYATPKRECIDRDSQRI